MPTPAERMKAASRATPTKGATESSTMPAAKGAKAPPMTTGRRSMRPVSDACEASREPMRSPAMVPTPNRACTKPRASGPNAYSRSK